MNNTLLNTKAAAQLANEKMPEISTRQWTVALLNNRRPTSNPVHKIPYMKIGRNGFYKIEDINAFVVFEQSRRVGTIKLSARAAEAMSSIGFNEQGGSSTGRRFELTSISAQIDDDTGDEFVQMITSGPLRVYRLSQNEAASLAHELTEALTEFRSSATASEQPFFSRCS